MYSVIFAVFYHCLNLNASSIPKGNIKNAWTLQLVYSGVECAYNHFSILSAIRCCTGHIPSII